ncbi:MAG: AAA family ATPase, partial [Verrucomicrobiales bacterium]|nr:AAA family ATPase [Verrucomicrobiales bacterium]
MKRAPVWFVTGTDTGVGKTVLTASVVRQWRAQRVRARAVKPLCSGGRDD